VLAVHTTTSGVIGLRVGDLELWLDARGSDVHLAVPPCHAMFKVAGASGAGLTLRVRDGPLRPTEGWRSLFYDAETWQLWLDGAERYVFVAPRHSPPCRQIAVDAGFRVGEVTGEFGGRKVPARAVYPLSDIDIIIFSNWLAESGDLIVHASGIEDDGAGYAFVGHAGAGKSTLIGEVVSPLGRAADAATTNGERRGAPVVLGEDQVIVRCREGQFLVYGTPWHTNPARCSPGGVPLKKLFFLNRAAGHGVEPCGRRAGIERLLQDAFIPYYNRAGTERILDTLLRLAEQVPFYTLDFRIGADVMSLIRAA